jgi:signal transduction histidine kinase
MKHEYQALQTHTLESETPISRRLQALTSASLAISSELDLDSVLQQIADQAREFGQSKYAAIGIVNDKGFITSFITSGISREEREKIGEPPKGHGLLGVLIRQGKPLRVPDMSKDPRRSGFPPNHPVMTSLLGVPVSINNRVVGDLYLTDKIGSHEFSAEDEWWVLLLARQAAVAVENANLYRKVRIARQRAEMLAEVAGSLNRSIEPEELFRQITQAGCTLLEMDAAALFLLDERKEKLVLKAEQGLVNKPCGETFLPLEGSVAGQVIEKDEPLFMYETHNVVLPDLVSGSRARALLSIPIHQYGEPGGVLEVYSTRPHRFNAEEITLLHTFAAKAGLALEKAQLYREKEQFLSMTAHDLRAPLTAIKMSAGLLETSLPDGLSPALTRLVVNIRRNGDRLSNMLNDLLDLTRLEHGNVQLKMEPLEIGEAIAATAHTLTPLFEEKQQRFIFNKPDYEYWVNADRRRLEQVLVNLLSNAIKYTPPEGEVSIKLEITQDWITTGVCDSGGGIPSEEQARIFDRYYRRPMHEQTEANSGTGLGLPIARHLVEVHGGQIWVESEQGKGSAFYFKLPRINQ